jgi:FSR family fosmidomycin resistance protein-like MFS transporter
MILTAQVKSTDIKIIFALTLVHFMGDFYSSFVTPLLPTFVNKLSLSLAQVGLIMGIVRFLAFIVQPSVGYFSDRYQTRSFALGGLLLTVLFIPLSGIAPSYFLLTLFLAVGSFGSSMFHPSVTGMVPVYGGRNAGFSMSVFNTGGTLAFGVGPIFITWFVVRYGLSAMPLTMLIGLAAMIFLYRAVPMPVNEQLKYSGFVESIKDAIGGVWKPIFLIWISIGTMISFFVVAGTTSGLMAGFLSDRIGFKPLFHFAHALMTPSLLLFIFLPGSWAYFGAFIAGFFVLASLPLGVVMAQELAPKGRSMVASLMMGFAYGLGGVVSPLTGKLADIFSIHEVLYYTAFIPLLTVVLIFFFPRVGGKKQK